MVLVNKMVRILKVNYFSLLFLLIVYGFYLGFFNKNENFLQKKSFYLDKRNLTYIKPKQSLNTFLYHYKAPPQEIIIFQKNQSLFQFGDTPSKQNVTLKDIFSVLKKPQVSCKKLVKFGGDLACLTYSKLVLFDGFKLGLGPNHVKYVQKNGSSLYTVDTLEGHLLRDGLVKRAVHILKIDIEGFEWAVLEQLTSSKILDLVGQIAVELHFFHIFRKSEDQKIQALTHHYKILQNLEKRGFKKVVYWPTLVDQNAYFENGERYDSGVEILFVNTNWYNQTFMEELQEVGVIFQ